MSEKQYHIGKWNDILSTFNAERVWAELHRIIAKNKLSRNHVKHDGFIDEGKYNYFVDLTQELFTLLLEKNRFQHYIDTEMSDVEIEIEISQIEISNMMTLKLRKRFPERFRMSRRISNILKNSDEFFESTPSGEKTRLSERTFVSPAFISYIGINATDNIIEAETTNIPHVNRDIRFAGATGDTQIIISNPDLVELIKTILYKVGLPMSVRQIRNVVIRKLNLMDISISHVEELAHDNDGDEKEFDIADVRPNPEQSYVTLDFEHKINNVVDDFMWKLSLSVRHKQKQFKLTCNILYVMYLTEPLISQLSVSKRLGVSDALISGYRKSIESLLKELKITTIGEGKLFEQALKVRLETELEK